jgi:hypothetical protein
MHDPATERERHIYEVLRVGQALPVLSNQNMKTQLCGRLEIEA